MRTEESRNAGEPEFDFLVTLGSNRAKRVHPDYPWYDEGYARIQPNESIFLPQDWQIRQKAVFPCSKASGFFDTKI